MKNALSSLVSSHLRDIADKLDFVADTSMICGSDDVTIGVVSNKENSK